LYPNSILIPYTVLGQGESAHALVLTVKTQKVEGFYS
jgi:hypothetical protein